MEKDLVLCARVRRYVTNMLLQVCGYSLNLPDVAEGLNARYNLAIPLPNKLIHSPSFTLQFDCPEFIEVSLTCRFFHLHIKVFTTPSLTPEGAAACLMMKLVALS